MPDTETSGAIPFRSLVRNPSMDAPRPRPAQAVAAPTDTSLAQALEARITHARIRMLYGHMPVTAWTLFGFTLIIGGLLHFTQRAPSACQR